MSDELLVTGRDGRTYPARKLPRAELNRVRWLTHRLHCQDHRSQREIQRILREQHNLRRSTGSIASDLANFQCSLCAGDG